MKKITIGTRGSQLAVTQANRVIEQLKEKVPDLAFELKTIITTGDKDRKTDLDKFAGLGVFVKELQIALMQGEIDCAVHSLKDVPEKGPEQLALVSFPVREDARDVFVSGGPTFMEMPRGSRIGTGSPRRAMQLSQLRPDVHIEPLRGNLETRIQRVREAGIDGIVLAAAGLKRLHRQSDITGYFSFDQVIPAIGQGSLALECRTGDRQSIGIAELLNDPITEIAVLIEREFMVRMGGGCKVPMACHCYPYLDGFRAMAALGDAAGGKICRMEQNFRVDEAEGVIRELCRELLEDCREQGIPVPAELPEHALLRNPAEDNE